MATIHNPIIFSHVAVGGYVGNLNAFATTEQIYLNSVGYQGDNPDPQDLALVGFNQFTFLNPAFASTSDRAVEVGISNAGSISFTSIRTFLHFDASSIVNNFVEGELFTGAELRLQDPAAAGQVNFRIFRSTAWEAGLTNNPPVSDFRQADFSTGYSPEIFFSDLDTNGVFKIPLNEGFLNELNSSEGKIQLAIVDTITAGHIIGNSIDSVSIRNTGFNFSGNPSTTTLPQLILTSGFDFKNPYKGVINQIQLSTKAKSFSDMVRDYENLKHRYS